jgi:crotonobetainyl-CoA:carnitine CoA-transferase CaiB-like acyl-CoA transferase
MVSSSEAIQRLDQLVVVEVGGSVAGAFAAKLLAGLGAQVTVVKPPADAPAERSAAADLASQAWFGASKMQVSADTERVSGTQQLSELPGTADVLIESSSPGPLRPLELETDPPGLVRLQLSPFARTGPYSTWEATDIVDQAISGHLYLSGDPQREPLQGPTDQAALAAGVYGAIGVVAALFARQRSEAPPSRSTTTRFLPPSTSSPS